MNIKKNDTVKIISGKDRGKTGKVIKIFPREKKIVVEGVNVYKKHVRPKREGEKGEIIQVIRPLQISNTMVICHSCGKSTRVGHKFDNKKKLRVCRKCKSVFN